MAITGILQGLGNEGASQERARQQAIIEALSQAQEKRAQAGEARAGAEERRRQQETDIRTRQAGAKQPVGPPYRSADGKTYQRYADPNTGAITTEAVSEPQEESPVQKIMRELKDAESGGIKLTPEQKQQIVEAALGGKGMLTQPRADKFGSFIPDPKSPTGFSREILDGTSLAPTGRKDYGMPPGAIPTEHTGFKVVTDEDGKQYLVPITTTSQKRGATPAGSGKGTTSGRGATASPGATGTQGKGVSGNLPPGAKPFGQKPLDAMSRRALVAANQSVNGINRIAKIFENRPELKTDNNPMGPAISWIEYQHGHFDPGGVRGELIKEAALVGITAAGLYSQGRMSRYLFEKAQQHLPQPNDSPQLLYSKIKWLKDNHIIDDMIQDIKNPFQGGGSAEVDRQAQEIIDAASKGKH